MQYIRQRYIALATLLVTLGLLLLLNNFRLLRIIDFGYIWILWPLVLMLFGSYFLVKGTKFAPIITSLTAFLTAIVIFASLTVFNLPFIPKIETGRQNSDNPNLDLGDVNIFDRIEKAQLNFKSSRVNLILKNNSWTLTEYETRTTYGEYLYERNKKDRVEVVDLRFSEDRLPWNIVSDKNEIDLKLNSRPVWDLNFDLSTNSNANLDLSYYRLEKLRLKTSTSAAKVNFDNKSFDKDIQFELDASNAPRIEIRVPSEIGIEIKLKSSFSNNDLGDINKVDGAEDIYRSDNFTNAEKKLIINADTSFSSFKIERY